MAKGGKGSRSRRKAKRMAERRAAKAEQKALYARYAAEGKAKGKDRNKASATVSNTSHPDGPCGNIACAHCFEEKTIQQGKVFAHKPTANRAFELTREKPITAKPRRNGRVYNGPAI